MEEKKTLITLDKLITQLEKAHGKGAVQYGNTYSGTNIERWPVSSPLISDILGGGLPKGRIIEIYGPESSGKTSLACYLAGEAQKAGEIVEYIDAEFAAELDYAKTMGLDREKLLLSQPNSGEESLQIALETIESGLVKIIIIDSVSALTPQAEIDGEMGDQQMGAQARLMGKGLRKLVPVCGKMGATIIFINQIRMKIGVMYGNPETTSGGQALKFYSSVRLEVRKVEFLTKGQEPPYGLITRITAKKNKTAPPYRKGEAKIIFGEGFQYNEEYIDFAVKYDIIRKGGSWYTLSDDKRKDFERIQGKENVVAYCVDNPEYLVYIKNRVEQVLHPIDENEEKEPV